MPGDLRTNSFPDPARANARAAEHLVGARLARQSSQYLLAYDGKK